MIFVNHVINSRATVPSAVNLSGFTCSTFARVSTFPLLPQPLVPERVRFCCQSLCSFRGFLSLLGDFFKKILFSERERGKHLCVVAPPAPPTGDLAHNTGLCPDGIEPAPPCFAGRCSTQRHTSQGSLLDDFKLHALSFALWAGFGEMRSVLTHLYGVIQNGFQPLKAPSFNF